METILICSSHGKITINRETLQIIKVECDDFTDPDNTLPKIIEFDFDEWKSHYKEELPPLIDILDLGYWYKSEFKTNLYEEPAHDWRKTIVELRSENTGYYENEAQRYPNHI